MRKMIKTSYEVIKVEDVNYWYCHLFHMTEKEKDLVDNFGREYPAECYPVGTVKKDTEQYSFRLQARCECS